MSKLARYGIAAILLLAVVLEVFVFAALRGDASPHSFAVVIAVYGLVGAGLVWLADWLTGRSRRAR
jgi:ABC-type Fe3+ transport system permease subunit